jgi:hypothetical protein
LTGTLRNNRCWIVRAEVKLIADTKTAWRITMRLAIAATVAAFLAAGSAFAGDDNPGAGADKGKAGAGRGEMLMKLFEKADANGDGKVSLEEFKKAIENAPKGKLKDKPEMIDKLFKRIDANGDGFITKEEMKKFVEKLQNHQGQKKPSKP